MEKKQKEEIYRVTEEILANLPQDRELPQTYAEIMAELGVDLL